MATSCSATWFCSRHSTKFPGATEPRFMPTERFCSHTTTSRSWFGKSNGWRMRASTVLKMVVLAPMPRARVRTATAVKPGCFRRERMENFKSRSSESIAVLPYFLVDSDNHQRRVVVDFAIAEFVHRSHDPIAQLGSAEVVALRH